MSQKSRKREILQKPSADQHSPSNQSAHEVVVLDVKISPLFEAHKFARSQCKYVVEAVLA